MRDDLAAIDTITMEETRPSHPEGQTFGLTLLFHPNVQRVGEIAPLFSSQLGGRRELSRVELPFFASATGSGQPLETPLVSRRPIVFRTLADGTLWVEAQADASASFDGQPLTSAVKVDRERLQAGVLLELGRSVLLLLHWVDLPPTRAPAIAPALKGNSRAIQTLRKEIERVARVDEPVLVRGPTGTGKELVAAAIHAHSARCGKPFVAVNMAALHGETATAALFGHARGAFTGATQPSSGYFGAAAGGTLFLDEVGELPRALQGQLLRALREGEVQPLGEAKPRKVDVRIISATDANLEELVATGAFALPLLRRLDALCIELPPLTQRRDDIARLTFHFLRQELERLGKSSLLEEAAPGSKPWFSLRVLYALLGHTWPGNVAELRSVVTRLALECADQDRCVLSEALARRLSVQSTSTVSAASEASSAGAANRRDVREIADAEIAAVMRACGFKVKAAAEQLGVSRSWLNTRLEHCEGVRKAKQLTDTEIARVGAECAWDIARMATQLEVSEHGLKLRLPPRS